MKKITGFFQCEVCDHLKEFHESFIGGNHLDTLCNIAKFGFEKQCFIHNNEYPKFNIYQQAIWIEINVHWSVRSKFSSLESSPTYE